MKFPIYLDYAATTPIHAPVIEAMLPYFQDNYGNSGSQQHLYGWQAEESIEQSRATIAQYFKVKSRQVIFTSGATESNNLAIQGCLKGFETPGHIITCSTEHKAVLEVFRFLESQGWQVTYLKVDTKGQISLDDLERSIQQNTHLISVMWVNNETGIVHPINEIIKISRKHEIVFHCDATQALGKLDLQQQDLPDLLSFSSHKIYGPKGIGGLILNNELIKLYPLVFGGNQERGLRSGTLPTQQIVGMAKAFELIPTLLGKTSFYQRWRFELIKMLESKFGNKVLIHSNDSCVPSIFCFSVKDIDWEELFQRFHKLALSNGSACNAKTKNPSHVFLAMGMTKQTALSTVRLSMGYMTTDEEMEFALNFLEQQLSQLI